MSKQVWICEDCLKLWKDEKSAKACEARHPKINVMAIKAIIFDPSEYQTEYLDYWPKRITILNKGVPHMARDLATYELKQIGPKGC